MGSQCQAEILHSCSKYFPTLSLYQSLVHSREKSLPSRNLRNRLIGPSSGVTEAGFFAAHLTQSPQTGDQCPYKCADVFCYALHSTTHTQ